MKSHLNLAGLIALMMVLAGCGGFVEPPEPKPPTIQGIWQATEIEIEFEGEPATAVHTLTLTASRYIRVALVSLGDSRFFEQYDSGSWSVDEGVLALTNTSGSTTEVP